MDDNQIITSIKDWILPLFSLLLSLWFAATAKRDASKAEDILKKINDAVEGWQQKIMGSTVNILDSMPQVIEGRVTIARINAAQALTQGIQQAIHEISVNPQSGSAGHTQEQTLKVLVAQLNELLEKMTQSPRV